MSVTHEKTSTQHFDNTRALRALSLARDTLQIEADAILALKDRLGSAPEADFALATGMLFNCRGRVVVSGMGKSGHIARKIAATLASTGILPVIKRIGARLISMTGRPDSTLARLADVHLNVAVAKEACPLNLAPTASTTVTLALGDALAVALLDARGFREEDFARSHPGGALGRRLLTHVRDIMRTGEDLPAVAPATLLPAALLEVTRKGLAMTAVVDDDFKVLGIFTDGDLRRLIEQGKDFSHSPIKDVMHANPRMLGPDQLAVEAVELMEQYRINQVLVIDADGTLVGALHIHDLTRAKVI